MRGFVKWTFEKVWDYFQSQLKYFIECLSIYLIKSNWKSSENQWNQVHFCWKLCVSIFHVLIARFISPFVAIDLDYTDKTRWKNVNISIYERTKINNYQTSHLIIFSIFIIFQHSICLSIYSCNGQNRSIRWHR